jgi:voltage-gated potassium channel
MDKTLKKRLYQTGFALLVVLSMGTFGFYIITDFQYNIFTCFYMTVLTVTTIGFDEIIALKDYELGRPFTVFIAFSGIGVLTYFVSTVSAVIIDGHYRETYKKRKMEKSIDNCNNHYIICGIGKHSMHLIDELVATERESVCIDLNANEIKQMIKLYPDEKYIEGDATHNDTLRKAGVEKATGLFATTNDDNINLVITLLARRLNPNIRIISLCINHDNKEKIMMAGADNVVSPNYIGGLRMANLMLRPVVSNFLDLILRDKYKDLRFEQVNLKESHSGKKLGELKLYELKETVVISLESDGELIFNPPDNVEIKDGDSIIIITTPKERIKLSEMND